MSVPLKLAAGVYVHDAPTHTTAPCAGPPVTANDSASPSGSLPVNVASTGVSSAVVTARSSPVGPPPITVIVTVPVAVAPLPSESV